MNSNINPTMACDLADMYYPVYVNTFIDESSKITFLDKLINKKNISIHSRFLEEIQLKSLVESKKAIDFAFYEKEHIYEELKKFVDKLESKVDDILNIPLISLKRYKHS
jgi:hypothetical protein